MYKLSLLQAIPLGIGSIIGSGILFLPSMTYKVSGTDVLVSWLLILALCLPGILFFNEMVSKLKPSNTSLSGIVELGLGKDVGNAVHLIMLGTVVIGMPSAAIVAGSYIEEILQVEFIKIYVSFLLISFALLINYFGLKTSSSISFIISALLVLVSVYLISETAQPVNSYESLKPNWNLGNIYSGSVLSFWAFAGFENLTFLYHRFKNPRRDLIVTIFVSIIVCGLLYLGLVANYSAIVPFFEIQQATGLLQMAKYAGGNELSHMIGIFALLAVAINLVSWTGGVVQLILQGSQVGVLPSVLQRNDKYALFFLGSLFYTFLVFGLLSPNLFEGLLTIVSTNFLVLYLLAIVSYVLITENLYKKILSALIAICIVVTLSSSAEKLLYPFLLFLLSFVRTKSYAKA